MPYILSPKMLNFTIMKNNYRLEMINPFYINNLSLLCHSSVFFIISLSKAVYLRSLGGMCECNIYGFVFNTHTHIHTHSWLLLLLLFICTMEPAKLNTCLQ